MMSVKEVAEYFSVDRTTIYAWMKKGLNSFKLGGLRKFRKEDIEKFMMVNGYTGNFGVKTPCGYGKYIRMDEERGMVTVEMDHEYLVDFRIIDCEFEGAK